MMIDLNYEFSDAHIHFGTSSLIGVTVDETKLRSYISSNQLKFTLVFPDDYDYSYSNYILANLLPTLEGVYGLVRVQMNGFDFNSVTGLLRRTNSFLGVKFHPSFDKIPVINKKYDELFQWLEEKNKLTLIHCGRWKEVTDYTFAFKRAEDFPNLTLIIAHMGGNILVNSLNTIELAQSFENVYLDTSNCRIPYIIERAVDRLGPDRILFGSDMPWGSCLSNAFTIIDSTINESAKRKILSNNLEAIIKKVEEPTTPELIPELVAVEESTNVSTLGSWID